MKYFLDSAKLDEIKEAYHTFGIDGVTTNLSTSCFQESRF